MFLRQLRYFTKIVELGSFSRAAREIFVAQPALSNQIAALEAELKTQLLVRGPRGVRPTTAGLTLYRTASSVLRQLDSVRRDVTESVENPRGPVSIGIPMSTAGVLALPIIREVRNKYPDIRLQVMESFSGLLKELLLHGRLDMALLLNENSSRNVLSYPLLSETLFLASPPRKRRGARTSATVKLADLSQRSFVLPSRFVPLRQSIESALENVGLILNVVAEIDSVQTLKAAVEAGLGSTILPWSALHKEAKAGSLSVQKIVEPSISWNVSLCTTDNILNTAAAQVVRELIPAIIATLVQQKHWQGVALAAAQRP
jgi:LysR family transcriptional regulator, nitrogen assimilation regulatory protein